MEKKIQTVILFTIITGFLFGWANYSCAAGAMLYLSPEKNTYMVGEEFSVAIKIDSGATEINAAEAVLSYSSDRLSIKRISKSGSLFTLWVQEPFFSSRSITFGGGAPNGFSGVGKIITVVFQAKAEGTATVDFLNKTRILANDGSGTDVFAGSSGGIYIIKKDERPLPAEGEVPFSPEVYSLTHSDSEKWYSNDSPRLNWFLPSDIIEMAFTLDKNPSVVVSDITGDLFDSKLYQDIKDGIWYFHIKFKNKYGWSDSTHYKVQTDVTPPLPFDVTVIEGEETTNLRPTLLFKAEDEDSGIDYYKIKIDSGDFQKIAVSEDNLYQIQHQELGLHLIEVKAVDKAGNSTESWCQVLIKQEREFWQNLGFWQAMLWSLILLLLIILLLFLILLGRRKKEKGSIKKVKKEVAEVEEEVTKSFGLLRQNIEKMLEELETTKPGKKPTEQEQILKEKLKVILLPPSQIEEIKNKRIRLTDEKNEIAGLLNTVVLKEQEIEIEARLFENREKAAASSAEKRKIEQERWETSKRRRKIEEQRWELEESQQDIDIRIKRVLAKEREMFFKEKEAEKIVQEKNLIDKALEKIKENMEPLEIQRKKLINRRNQLVKILDMTYVVRKKMEENKQFVKSEELKDAGTESQEPEAEKELREELNKTEGSIKKEIEDVERELDKF